MCWVLIRRVLVSILVGRRQHLHLTARSAGGVHAVRPAGAVGHPRLGEKRLCLEHHAGDPGPRAHHGARDRVGDAVLPTGRMKWRVIAGRLETNRQTLNGMTSPSPAYGEVSGFKPCNYSAHPGGLEQHQKKQRHPKATQKKMMPHTNTRYLVERSQDCQPGPSRMA